MISTQPDIVRRMKAVLPVGWFGDATPLLDSLLVGLEDAWTRIYWLLADTARQTRIKTASGVWLDLTAADFFGSGLSRHARETDGRYRARILSSLLRERTTRRGMQDVLADLTGRTPKIFEPGRCGDTGGYGVSPGTTGGLAYNVVGGWGNINLPHQCFITAYRPVSSGIGLVTGWNCPAGGYGSGSIEYGNIDLMEDRVSDAEILSAISATLPAATIAWTRITD